MNKKKSISNPVQNGNTSALEKSGGASVLLIYTGGTIGMMQDAKSGQLKPFDFKQLTDQIPELQKFDIKLSSVSFEVPIDSSDMQPSVWVELVNIIKENYSKVDGFVILHGSDTMSFTASALSFMLENLNKPVILTGSQLPIGTIRTDGKENLITAIEIAGAKVNGKPVISEVCIYFEFQLYRGNRTHKFNAEHFKAFQSSNYPILAEAGVYIKYNQSALMPPNGLKLKTHTELNQNIVVLKLFPGITSTVVNAILDIKNLRAVVLETFGSGNCTTEPWFIKTLQKAIQKGVIILNVTQCNAGAVVQGKYATSAELNEIGVVSGNDITTEAAITKLMFLLGATKSTTAAEKLLKTNIRGEVTVL